MKTKLQIVLAIVVLVFTLLLTLLPGCTPAGPSGAFIRILGSPAGGSSHQAMYATADIVTKYSGGIRMEVQETLGSEDNRRMYKAMSTDEKKTTMLNCDGQGYGVLKSEGTDMKTIARLLSSAFGYITFNKAINSVEDLVGKRVVVGPKGGGIYNVSQTIMEAHGILNKMTDANLLYMAYNDGAQALLDGLVDAQIAFYQFGFDGKTAQPPAYLVPVTQKAGVKIIGLSQNALNKVKTAKMPLGTFQMPGGTMPYAPKEFWMATEDSSVLRGADVIDSNVVYNIVKTMCENDKKYIDYSKSLFQVEAQHMARLPLPETDFHPGAVKYYKEKGIKIGY